MRYLGLEFGMNAFQPTSPARVLIQRHGDCKDKVLLLKALLAQVGVRSTPILVSTSLGKSLAKRLPNAGSFNHVILQIHHAGRDHFVDPTITHQGGSLKTLFIPNYSYGLPIGNQGAELIEIPKNNLCHSEVSAHSILKMENEGEIEVETTISYSGNEADFIRELLAREGNTALLDNLSSFYSSLHGDVISSEIEVDDQLEKNDVRVKSYIKLTRYSNEDPVSLQPIFLGPYFTQNVDIKRQFPLSQDHPNNIREKVTFQAPILFNKVQKKRSFDHDWGSLDFSMLSHGKDLTLEYAYASKTDHISPQDLLDFRSYIRSTSKEVMRQMELPKFPENVVIFDHPSVGYALLALAMAVFSFSLVNYFKNVKQKKKAWLLKLSLIKKR